MSGVLKVFNERAHGSEILLERGRTFRIRLEENRTAGFRWQIAAGAAPVCTLVDDTYEPPSASVLGRAGVHTWTYRVEQAGRAIVELDLRRPWDSDAPPAKSFRITVQATGEGHTET